MPVHEPVFQPLRSSSHLLPLLPHLLRIGLLRIGLLPAHLL